jgi:hypothetical protein
LAVGDITANLAEYFVRYNLANTRWELLNAAPTSEVSCAQVTDSTDIALSVAPTHTAVGSTVTLNIPTKGMIDLEFLGQAILAASSNLLILGVRIGSTNYWPEVVTGAGTNYGSCAIIGVGTTTMKAVSTYISNGDYLGATSLSIEKLSIPTGAQTVQIVAAKSNANTATLKGTVESSIVNITVRDHN